MHDYSLSPPPEADVNVRVGVTGLVARATRIAATDARAAGVSRRDGETGRRRAAGVLAGLVVGDLGVRAEPRVGEIGFILRRAVV